MIYPYMLAILPIVVVVYLWGDGSPNLTNEIRILLSAILLALSAAGFLDVGSDENAEE